MSAKVLGNSLIPIGLAGGSGPITILSAVMDLTQGDANAALILTLSRAPGNRTFDATDSGFTLAACARSWNFGDLPASGVIVGNILTIQAITGFTMVDTQYNPAHDLFSYAGLDNVNLPNVQQVTNMPVTYLYGPLAVPRYINWVSATSTLAAKFSRQLASGASPWKGAWSAIGNNRDLVFANDGGLFADVATFTGVTVGASHSATSSATYTGGDTSNMLDDAGQLIPPFDAFAMIALSAPVLTFTGFNTATLVLTLSSAPGNGSFTPTGMTLHAAGRSWSFAGATATVSGTTLTITGLVGTVIDANYSTSDDLFSYDASDGTHLPKVNPATNLAVTFTGGALTVPTGNADVNTTSQLTVQAMSGSLGAFVTPTDSYFTGWLSNVRYNFVGFVSVSGSSLLITAGGAGTSDTHASQLRYDGKNPDMVDGSGRPLPPFTQTAGAMSAGGYPSHNITTASTVGPTNREYSGMEYDAANDIFWAIDDGGVLMKLSNALAEVSTFSLGGDKEGIALVEARPNNVYVLNEGPNAVLGSLDEFSISGGAVARNFAFPVEMPVGSGGNGDEGVAYIDRDPNFAGKFVVGHQSNGDLHFLTPDFTAGTLTYLGKITLSLGSDDAASVETLNDGTILVFFDNIDTIYRIRLSSGILGTTIDTNSAAIVEKWVHENVGGDAEAFCIKSIRAGSGVRETHDLITGDDRGGGNALLRHYGNVPMAIYPLAV